MSSADEFTPSGAAKAAQWLAILDFLKRHKEAATITLREELGVCHPAGRICELRKAGWPIETRRGWVYSAQGRKHPNAVYVLTGTPC